MLSRTIDQLLANLQLRSGRLPASPNAESGPSQPVAPPAHQTPQFKPRFSLSGETFEAPDTGHSSAKLGSPSE